jgi:hypothetical protein
LPNNTIIFGKLSKKEKNMKSFILLILSFFLISSVSYSQRILIDENFENSGFNTDSLPTGWAKFDEDNTNQQYPLAVWSVRDTSARFPGVNQSLHSFANNYSRRSISIPWRAGDPVADDYLFTDSVRIQQGDSLIFWMLFGTPSDSITGINLSPYFDTMQVGYALIQQPFFFTKLGPTLRSQDSNNVWVEFKYDLSSLAGQSIFIVFRYYMNTTEMGLFLNIDDIFVGNRSAIGIQPISSNVPQVFALRQNYPNPFNPVTYIEFDLPKDKFVNLIVFNSLGQEVKTLVNQDLKAGSYKVDFNAGYLPSGVYYYRITAGDFVKTNKMILVK